MGTARAILVTGLLALAMPVSAQAPVRIAWIWPGTESGELPRSSAFKEGMRENGFVEGRDFVLDERFANGNYERFPAITKELLARKPAILMVNTIASVRAAQQATSTVPIVFVATNDPVGSGLIASLARPGGNTTGLSTQNEDVMTKSLQLLREVMPRANRIAVLVNPGNPSGPKLFEFVRASAREFGIEAFSVEVTSPQNLDAGLNAAAERHPDALIGVPDAMLFSERDRITAFGLRQRIPLIGTSREMVVAGALMSYGNAQLDLFRRAATFVKRILAGARPADLPVEQPIKFELVINLKTAKALGLSIPQSLTLRADEVIRD
jgi:putative ABC transport system substrate-binding protein